MGDRRAYLARLRHRLLGTPNRAGTSVATLHHEAREYFNRFVDEVHPQHRTATGERYAWPGDEWSSPDLRERIFSVLMAGLKLGTVKRIVEIGPGSGKYTEMLLRRSACAVRAYDMSDRFLDVLGNRCHEAIRQGRLTTHLMNWEANRGFLDDLAAAGWTRTIDALVGVDVFIHIDLQALVVYLLTAALALRHEGKLLATFANPLSPSGTQALLAGVREYAAFQTRPSSKFHWITNETLRALLPILGFRIDNLVDGDGATLDFGRSYVVATLSDLSAAEGLRALLDEDASANRGPIVKAST